jgi:hypothetical protein
MARFELTVDATLIATTVCLLHSEHKYRSERRAVLILLSFAALR